MLPSGRKGSLTSEEGKSGSRCMGASHCGKRSRLISQSLGICLDCIRQDFAAVLPNIEQAHSKARSLFNLPVHPPESETGRRCQICVNECCLTPGSRSYCGLRSNEANKLKGATADNANVSWYYDPLPTNCVADWVCAPFPSCCPTGFAKEPGPDSPYLLGDQRLHASRVVKTGCRDFLKFWRLY